MAPGGTLKKKGAAISAGMIILGFLLACCIIATSRLRPQYTVLTSGDEYESEHALSAAITMGMKTNQTDLFTYPDEFNKTLVASQSYIIEAQNAVKEAKTLNEVYKGYSKGSDPW